MKKLCLNIFIIAFFSLLVLFIGNNCFAYDDYKIDKYSIDMTVNEDNTFNITEKITAVFKQRTHGLYRTIPLINNVKRLDGSESQNRVKITDVNVSENFSKKYSDGMLLLKIGSASSYVYGSHDYTISYKYNIGKDPLKNSDELYFNLIGNGWDVYIHNIDFKINMPKDFDSSSLGFSSGKYGETESPNVEYSVDGRVISGSLSQLYPRSALTVRLTLPEDYFVGESLNIDFISILTILFCVGAVFVAFVFWFKYGKDDKVIETVEFYPPDGLNSAELAYVYNELETSNGVISLLFYLANKGYLKIEETNKKETGYSFKITKLKDYDGDNSSEEVFMHGLFLDKDYATDKTLENKFYITISMVSRLIKKDFKDKIYTKSKDSKQNKILVYMIAFLTIITFYVPAFFTTDGINLIGGLTFFLLFFFSFYKIIDFTRSKLVAVSGTIFCGLLLLFSSLFVFRPVVESGNFAFITFIVKIVTLVILLVFLKLLRKKNSYGTQISGKLRGFRRFLKIAKKEELEFLVKEKPQYFYDMLPFAYALGVTDKWVKKFEVIGIQEPTWYSSYNTFSYTRFNHFMSKTVKTVGISMTSSPASSGSGGSGGGFSGGGFSGGGSGGGGGGSW